MSQFITHITFFSGLILMCYSAHNNLFENDIAESVTLIEMQRYKSKNRF